MHQSEIVERVNELKWEVGALEESLALLAATRTAVTEFSTQVQTPVYARLCGSRRILVRGSIVHGNCVLCSTSSGEAMECLTSEYLEKVLGHRESETRLALMKVSEELSMAEQGRICTYNNEGFVDILEYESDGESDEPVSKLADSPESTNSTGSKQSKPSVSSGKRVILNDAMNELIYTEKFEVEKEPVIALPDKSEPRNNDSRFERTATSHAVEGTAEPCQVVNSPPVPRKSIFAQEFGL